MPEISRFSRSVPLSIGVHLLALVALLIVPITADGDLPPVPSKATAYVAAMAIPPPAPPPDHRPTRASTPAPQPDAAPTTAPIGIRPEIPTEPPIPADVPVGEMGVPAGDLGAILEGAPPPPPPPPKPAGPIRVSQLVQPPRKIVDVRPTYPDIARQARIEGTVVLEAIVDPTGRVDHLRVVTSVPLLDAAALDAVRRWRYAPSVLNGQAVAVLMTVTVRFTLSP